MSNIIEKLGINTPSKIETVGDVSRVYELSGIGRPSCHAVNFFKDGERLKEILDDKNEMLEALIGTCLLLENYIKEVGTDLMPGDFLTLNNEIKRNLLTIQKATNKSWTEIKELIK